LIEKIQNQGTNGKRCKISKAKIDQIRGEIEEIKSLMVN
jgi:hypothetical protein